MYPVSIVIASHDPAIARILASSLDRHFRSVKLACSPDEVKLTIPRDRVDAVIADLESVALNEVAEISRDLNLPVFCTHRIPDDDMWTAALGAGALDVLANSDVTSIVASIQKNLAASRSTAA